jgi:phosphoenolpyruvate synthase/pyruvate phosphate dikinase
VIVRPHEGPPHEVGGKAAGLARLIALGLPVPTFVVVPASDAGALDDPGGLIGDLGEPLAVRSSAVGEDAMDRSAAGQFETVVGVRADGLEEAVRTVHDSAGSDRVAAYLGGPAAGMAVVIQREVPATRSGVAFSRDPMTGEDVVLVECVFGAGHRLVSGLADPDRFVVSPDGSVRARLAVKEDPRRTLRTLRDDEATFVANLVRRAADGFGHPVDVEFCIDADGPTVWLLQCRAVTASAGGHR